MEALVTGHAGYIGGELATQLRDAGHEVVGFDNDDDPADDIRDADRVRETFDAHDFDVAYHVAADADVWSDDWRYLVENNVLGAVNVAAAARDHGVPVVFASSVAGEGDYNRYGRSKNLAEQALDEFTDVTIVRFPNVIGGPAPRGQAQDMIEEALAGDIEVWGGGEIRRSYVDVGDLAALLRELGQGSFAVETPTGIFAHTTTNRRLGECIRRVVAEEIGREPDLTLVDREPPSPMELTADGIRVRDPTPLEASVRSQVRATVED